MKHDIDKAIEWAHVGDDLLGCGQCAYILALVHGNSQTHAIKTFVCIKNG